VKVFWSLEEWLAHARHFPAINWLTSYSQYHDELKDYYRKELGADWAEFRVEAMQLLQKESELKEIVRLVGIDALSDQDKLVLEAAKSVREDFLYQSAFDPVDTYASAKKQYLMLKLVLTFYREGKAALERGVNIEQVVSLSLREEISRARFMEEAKIGELENLERKVKDEMNAL
jgi:V/A-type H+-transporting ATPase subunit A